MSSSTKNGKTFKVTLPEKSVFKPNLFKMKLSSPKVVTYRNLHYSEDAYYEIMGLLHEDMIIENIVEINNPFLQKAYLLKRAQKRLLYGNEIAENLLFHGTKKENVESICTFNFNWRLFGKNKGHKFGQGVSFSNNAAYASHYSDESYHKVMIIAKVLIGKACQGNAEMALPPTCCDTSKKDNGVVVVKYEDNEFLPMYKIYYHFDEYSSEESEDDFYYDDYHVDFCCDWSF